MPQLGRPWKINKLVLLRPFIVCRTPSIVSFTVKAHLKGKQEQSGYHLLTVAEPVASKPVAAEPPLEAADLPREGGHLREPRLPTRTAATHGNTHTNDINDEEYAQNANRSKFADANGLSRLELSPDFDSLFLPERPWRPRLP